MKCRICNSNNCELIRNKIRHDIHMNVYMCKSCEVQFLESNPNLDYNKDYRKKYTPYYGKEFNSEQLFNAMLPIQKYDVDKIKYLIKDDSKILDIGCASGYLLYTLKNETNECWGVDIRNEDVEYAKSIGLNCHVGPIEDTDIPKNYFDIVLLVQTLEHIENPKKLLMSIKPYLKDNGIIFISVPSANDVMLTVYENEYYGDWFYEEPHLLYYSSKSLKLLCEECGYEGDIQYWQTHHILNHIRWLYNNTQQNSVVERVGNPIINDNNHPIGNDINKLIKLFNRKYCELLENNCVSDNIIFIGKKK